MWAVRKWGRYSVVMERSDVGRELVGRYSEGMERSDLGSEQSRGI